MSDNLPPELQAFAAHLDAQPGANQLLVRPGPDDSRSGPGRVDLQ
jgi:hypothetical protein